MRLPTETAKLLRGVAHLSLGTIVIQALGALGQVVFAIWLRPEDYGLWATATSSMVLLSGLVNLGEVNAYLSSRVADLGTSRRATRQTNVVLMLGGMSVVAAYAIAGRAEVAVLVALTAINLPLLGESNLLYAAYVRQRRNGTLIRAQVMSSLLRTVVGVLVAWLTGSALAFAISMICYSVTMVVVLRLPRSSRASEPHRRSDVVPRVRLKWSVHSMTQMLPSQVDFLVISLIASPRLLGVYYLSYQITVALSGLVVGPLSKTALSTLAATDREGRRRLGVSLMALASGGIGVLVCVGVVVVVPLAELLPVTWRDAVPTTCILLASLPARFLAVVTDAVLLADDCWWQSARLNGVDAVGTATAALFALRGDVLSVAVAIVVWQAGFVAVRVSRTLPGSLRQTLPLVVPNVLAAGLLTTGVLMAGGWIWPFAAMSALVASTPLAMIARAQQRRAPVLTAGSR